MKEGWQLLGLVGRPWRPIVEVVLEGVAAYRSLLFNNTALKDGGAIYCEQARPLSLQHVDVSANRAFVSAGGIFAQDTDVEFCKGAPRWCQVVMQGNIARASGGAMRVLGEKSDMVLKNLFIYDNLAGMDLLDEGSVALWAEQFLSRSEDKTRRSPKMEESRTPKRRRGKGRLYRLWGIRPSRGGGSS